MTNLLFEYKQYVNSNLPTEITFKDGFYVFEDRVKFSDWGLMKLYYDQQVRLGYVAIIAPEEIDTIADQTYSVGVAIADLDTTGVFSGTDPTYTISPAVPDGLTFSDGIISGTPTEAYAQTEHTVTATNDKGSATTSFNITVEE